MNASRAFSRITSDPYSAFFIVLVSALLSILVALASITLLDAFTIKEMFIVYPLLTLFVTAAMMNLGNQNPSSKQVFWGWITMMIGLASVATAGHGILFLLEYSNVI